VFGFIFGCVLLWVVVTSDFYGLVSPRCNVLEWIKNLPFQNMLKRAFWQSASTSTSKGGASLVHRCQMTPTTFCKINEKL
jgi:hypothetical protein